MKSNIDNFLSKSLSTYIFLLIIIFIMKLVGLDYFGIDLENEITIKINDFILTNYTIQNIIFIFPLLISQYIILSITLKDNSKKMIIFNLIILPIMFVFQCYKLKIFGNYSLIAEILYFYILIIIYNKKIDFKLFKKTGIVILLNILLQAISTLTRFNYSILYVNNVAINFLLNLDYIMFIVIGYKLYFTKGVDKKWYYLVEVSLSSLKKMNLKNLLQKLQRNLHSFKKLDKVDKLTIVIYLFLSLIWNVFTVVFVLFVATLNHTFIECIFILTSFWLSKRQFGKPFHLKSMSQCFVVSNLTYYILNRVTTPLGISIFIPILLGVSLSYFTSKLVKSENPKLYRGIPIDEFDKKILKVTDKNSLHYQICYMYYIERKSELEISHKTNYSIDNIKKIKSKMNKNIEKLQ